MVLKTGFLNNRLHKTSPKKARSFLQNLMWLFKNYGNRKMLAQAMGMSEMYCRVMTQPGIGHGRSRTTKNLRRPMPSLSTAIMISDYYGYDVEEMFRPHRQFLWVVVRKKPPTPPMRKGRREYVLGDIKESKRNRKPGQ